MNLKIFIDDNITFDSMTLLTYIIQQYFLVSEIPSHIIARFYTIVD